MTGIELIAAERERQINAEGWTAAHDDRHIENELARAAICYLEAANMLDGLPRVPTFEDKIAIREAILAQGTCTPHWPFEDRWFKFDHAQQCRVKAGALTAAEIDRDQRYSASQALADTGTRKD